MPIRFSWSKKAIYRIKKLPEPGSSVSKRTDEKRRRLFCGLSKIEMLKVVGSFLVPLVIGIFTVVTTIQQYQVSDQNRLKDLEIATLQRDQDQKQADTLQQETMYGVYIKEMGELSLKLKSKNVNNSELNHYWKLARAKTLSALRQLDTKRKRYLIQFLYEAELLFTNRPAIDLAGADLSGTTFLRDHVAMEFKFDYIALIHVILTNTSFANVYVVRANFSESLLNNANFSDAYLYETNFSGSLLNNANFSGAYLYRTNFAGCDLTNADLRGPLMQFSIMKNVNLSGAIFGEMPPLRIENSILPNGSYVFESNDYLKSDLFDSPRNLIINGDANCQSNIDATEIFGWGNLSDPVAIITNYSQLPSFNGNVTRGDCVFWGGPKNNSMDSLHQQVSLYDYSRLIDSGRALYEFSFDSGGIDAYSDCVFLKLQFNAHGYKPLEDFLLRGITNIERKNRSILCHKFIKGSVPINTRSLDVNIIFTKLSISPFNNGLIDNIKFYMKQMKKTDERPQNSSYSSCP